MLFISIHATMLLDGTNKSVSKRMHFFGGTDLLVVVLVVAQSCRILGSGRRYRVAASPSAMFAHLVNSYTIWLFNIAMENPL